MLSQPEPLQQQHSWATALVLNYVLLTSMEKRKEGHDGLSAFLVPFWLHKTISPVRRYPSWELRALLKDFKTLSSNFCNSLCFIFVLKWQVGNELSSCSDFPLFVVSERGGPFSERSKVLAPKFPLPLMEWKGWDPGNPLNTQDALSEAI